MRPSRRQLVQNDQVGFATTAKALMLVAAVTGGGLLATGQMKDDTPVPLPSISENMITAQALINDPDAELRP